MDLKIIIKKSEASRALIELAEVNNDALYLRIPSANVSAAQTELNSIDKTNWTASGNAIETNGQTNDGILLPKEVLG